VPIPEFFALMVITWQKISGIQKVRYMEKQSDKIGVVLTILLMAGLVATALVNTFTSCQLVRTRFVPPNCPDYPLFVRLLYSTVVIAGVLIVYRMFKYYKK
jgi:hypothetical protein